MPGNTGVAPGAGIAASRINSFTEIIGTTTKTSIHIDLTGLASINVDKDVIGLEAPATGSTDIDLYNANESTHIYNNPLVSGSSTEFLIVDGGGAWTNGMVKGGTTITFGATEYLYLVNGAASGAGTYTAGKYLIELWGVSA